MALLPDTAKRKIERNPCASTAVVLGTGMSVFIWVTGQLGLKIPIDFVPVITGVVTAACFAFSGHGLIGLWRFILYGRD
jgi:hypothetical protein